LNLEEPNDEKQPNRVVLVDRFSVRDRARVGRRRALRLGRAVPRRRYGVLCGRQHHARGQLSLDRSIRYYNCGIGGDRAAGIMSDEKYRLNVDILGHRPTVATIMLGMNDVGLVNYGPDKVGPQFELPRQSALKTYNENMVKLIAALKQSGARLILITPSIYDDSLPAADGKAKVYVGGNAGLGKCAEKVKQWAAQNKAGLVDFHGVMCAINEREQKKDPRFSVVGPERVHPGAVGHFVMAYVFLKAQGMPRDVARIGIDAAAKTTQPVNCRIDALQVAGAGLEFDCLENALPVAVPDDAKAALKLVPFTQDFNQETLTVAGLDAGRYELKIDGKSVGEYSAASLAAGVNLAENVNTPQYQQAAAATKLNGERFLTGVKLRSVAAMNYGMSRAKVNLADRGEVEKHVRAKLDGAKRAGKAADQRRFETYLQLTAEPGKLEKDYEDLAAALVKACQPRPHHFAILKK
jgi:lysophospholipase L1-like esterase